MRDRRRRNKGFTLAELLIVVAIMGILAAFGFVAVVQHQRNLKLTENDNIAREIYEGAQNHLTQAESSGIWSQKYESLSSNTDATDVTNEMKKYYGAKCSTVSIKDSNRHDMRSIIVNANNAQDTLTSTALSTILPIGSIDESIRSGGTYIIEYDAYTAQVYGVFYTDKDTSFSETDVKEIDKMDGGRDSKDNRIHYENKYQIGYYGGAEARKQQADSTAANDVIAPQVELLNEERLILKVTYDNNANLLKSLNKYGNSNEVTLKIELYDTEKPNDRIQLNASSCASSTSTQKGNAGNQYQEYTNYYIIDSIVDSEEKLAKVSSDNKTLKSWLAGRNIAAKVTVSYGNEKNMLSRSRVSNTVNSLFADGTKVRSDGKTVTVQTALIKNARHLENLSKEISGDINVNKAVISQSITWHTTDVENDDFFDGISTENSKYFRDKINDNYSNTVYFGGGKTKGSDAYTFYGIYSTSLTDVSALNGSVLSNFTIKESEQNNSARNDVGLFSRIEHDVRLRSLNLQKFTLNLSNSNGAGALIGVAADHEYKITNISVSNLTVNGNANTVGGLVGMVDGKKNTSLTATSVIFSGTNHIGNTTGKGSQQTGGFIGTATGSGKADISYSTMEGMTIDAECGRTGGIAGAVNGNVVFTSNNTSVNKIVISNVSQHAGGAIGIVNGESGGETATVNLNDIKITGPKITAGHSAAEGGIIGTTSHNAGTDKNNTVSLNNVKVTDPSLTEAQWIGGAVGQNNGSGTLSISSVEISGKDITIGNEDKYSHISGGLIGRITNGNVSVTGSDVASVVRDDNGNITGPGSGSIISYNGAAGGLLGSIEGGTLSKLSKSYVSVDSIGNANKKDTSSSVGGVIGSISTGASVTSVDQVYAGGRTYKGTYAETYTDESGNVIQADRDKNVYGGGNVGGFIGSCEGSLSVKNSYTTTSVYSYGNGNVGGFIGNGNSNITLNNVYCTGLVSSTSSTAVRGAFAGAIKELDNLKFCYAVNGINTGINVLGSGTATDDHIKMLNHDDSGITGNNTSGTAISFDNLGNIYAFKTVDELYASSKTGMHVGDWPTQFNVADGDAMIVYYEKVKHSDGTIDWYYHGYKQMFKLDSTADENDFRTVDNTDELYKCVEVQTSDTLKSRYASEGHPFVNDTADLSYMTDDGKAVSKDAGNEYVVEDGYAILLAKGNSGSLTANQIYFRQNSQNVTSLTDSNYTTADPSLSASLGYGNAYDAYVLKNNYFHYAGEDLPKTKQLTYALNILAEKQIDQSNRKKVCIAQFYLNPLFANCMGKDLNSMPSVSQFEVRSARQLSYLMNTGNDAVRDIMTTEWGQVAGYTITQTMDIDFNQNFTEAGKETKYSSNCISGTMDIIYQGASNDSDYHHIIKNMTSGFAENVTGKLQNLTFDGINGKNDQNYKVHSLITDKNYGIIHNISIYNSYFKNSAIAESNWHKDNPIDPQITDIVLKNVYTGMSGIVENNYNSIERVNIQNCKIQANGIYNNNNSNTSIKQVTIADSFIGQNGIGGKNSDGTIYDVTLNGTTTITGNGICSDNESENARIEKVIINAGVTINGEGFVSNNKGTITDGEVNGAVLKRNGVAATNYSLIENVRMNESTDITGNGIAGVNQGTIQNCKINGAVIRGNGIAGTNSGTIRYIIDNGTAINGSTIQGNGIVESNSGKIDSVTMTDSRISKNGIANELQNNSIVSNCQLTNVSIGGNGFATTANNAKIYSNKIVNAYIANNGLINNSSNNDIVDNHIYADKGIYDQNSHTKFVADENDDAAKTLKDPNGVYSLVVIGKKSDGTYEDNTAGFINKSKDDIIYGNSVTGTVYSSTDAAGFIRTLDGGNTVDNYANTLIWINGKEDSSKAAGFVCNVKGPANMTGDSAFGTVSSLNKGKVSGFGFSYSNSSRLQYCYSAVWYLHGEKLYAFEEKEESFIGKILNLSNCSFLKNGLQANFGIIPFDKSQYEFITQNPNEQTKGLDLKGALFQFKNYSYGLKATKIVPYYAFNQKPENGDLENPYPVPYAWTIDDFGNVVQQRNEDDYVTQTFYGDWFVDENTKNPTAPSIESTSSDTGTDANAEDGSDNGISTSTGSESDTSTNTGSDAGSNTNTGTGDTGTDSGSNTGTGTDTKVDNGVFADINSNPNSLSSIFSEGSTRYEIASGTLIQDSKGTYILVYSTDNYYTITSADMTAEQFAAANSNSVEIVNASTEIETVPSDGFTSSLQAGTIATDGTDYYVLKYKMLYNPYWTGNPVNNPDWAKIS